MPKSKTIKEGWFYLPTFLKDDKRGGPGTCTLIVRHFRVTEAASGRRRTAIKTDALEFPDEAAMLAEIEKREMVELPEEADGNPRYVPAGFEAKP